jgi:hypothetical protein
MGPIQKPANAKESHYTVFQAARRKDIERAFGALKIKFNILNRPSLTPDATLMNRILRVCVILHNMVGLTTHISHLTSHISHLTSHISHLTSHISHLTSHISHLTSHISHLTSHIVNLIFLYCSLNHLFTPDCREKMSFS